MIIIITIVPSCKALNYLRPALFFAPFSIVFDGSLVRVGEDGALRFVAASLGEVELVILGGNFDQLGKTLISVLYRV